MKQLFNPLTIEARIAQLEREQSLSGVRTSLCTLLLFESAGNPAALSAAVEHVLARRPTRLIRIQDGAPATALDVSVRCSKDAHGRGICVEELTVANGPDGAGAAPGSWGPLVLRDLPLYLVWDRPFTGNSHLFAHMREDAEKVIFDSQAQFDAGQSLNEIAQTVQREILDKGAAAADLAWKRLLPVQRLTALAFDHPELAKALPRIASLGIKGGPAASAWLFAAWVRSVLEDCGHPAQARQMQVATAKPGPWSAGMEICFGFVGAEGAAVSTLCITASPNGCGSVEYAGIEFGNPSCRFPGDGELVLEEIDGNAGLGAYARALACAEVKASRG